MSSTTKPAANPAGTGGPPPITAKLSPPPYTMGILPDFTRHDTPFTLRIRELKMALGSDDFVIKNAVSRNKCFSVNGKLLSMSGKKTLHDYKGKALFEFCRTGFGLKKSYEGYQCGNSSKTLFTVEKVGYMNPKLNIVFKNVAGDGRLEKWTLRGRWLGGSSQITTDSGFVVASISRDYANAGQILFNVQTYDVTVAPGVDVALISALCVCFDEAYHESNHGSKFQPF